MFYEAQNSQGSDFLKIETGSNFSFPPHLHGTFELISVTDGTMAVEIDKKEYILEKNEAVLVFPNQIHALRTNQKSSHILCIFSPHLVKAYSGVFFNKLPKDNRFSIDPTDVARLFELQNSQNLLQIKGLLYTLCAAFDAHALYVESKQKKEDLLFKIFRFVEENYEKDCSLSALAETSSYHSVYLSRYFKRSVGLSFTDYVNRYRINEASYALKNSSEKILDIAYNCGFDSLRTFNRNFKSIMGVTPQEYRKKTYDS